MLGSHVSDECQYRVVMRWLAINPTRQALYLWVVYSVPAAITIGHAFAPGQPAFKGHDWGIILGLVLGAISVLLWLPYRRDARWPKISLLLIAMAICVWSFEIARTQYDQSLFALTALLTPVFLLLILLKRAGQEDIRHALISLAYSLAVIALINLPFGALGLMPSGFEGADSAVCRTPIVCDITGNLDRWAGPFGSVNYAAPIGGLLIVLGFILKRPHAFFLSGTGALILILSQGRSAVLAVVAGLAILWLWGPRVRSSAHPLRIRMSIIALLLGLFLIAVVVFDPTLNGRTVIWGQFLELWMTSPWIGTGDSGIQAYAESRPGLLTFSHAHSVYLDLFVRWGPGVALLAITLFALTLIVTWRAIPRVGSGPLAITTFVIVAGLVETIHDWSYWTPYLAALVWAMMAAAPSVSGDSRPFRSKVRARVSLS